jgi:beta-lactamase regulating signal transducer with metallopeptidase domain
MLSEIFYWVLNASILGSLAGLIVLGLRKIKALPRLVVYVLWALPLLRLWCPFGLANEYSLLSLISKITTKTVVLREEFPQFTTSNIIMKANSYFPLTYQTNLLEQVFQVASLVWVIIGVSAILATIILYFLSLRALNPADLLQGNIYKADRITVPAVYGIIRPRIVIPKAMAEGSKDLTYIILHEQAHLRRRDNLFRLIAVITACVHWFNPLSWLFLKYFFIDMELACDAKVLKNLNESQTKEYALAILNCSSGQAFLAAAFGGAKTKERIENILTYQRLTLVSSLCSLALAVTIAVTIITNAAV